MSGSESLVAIVDDDEILRRTVSTVLRLEGFEVLEASDGADALERMDTNGLPRAIILDWSMPSMDGAAFRRIQRDDPALASIPVIVLTGDRAAQTEARDLGIEVVLTKPVRLEVLLSALGAMFPKSR